MSVIPIQSQQQTAWSVEHDRSADRGDSDRFRLLTSAVEDWIELTGTQPLDLGRVVAVDLTFGTITEPNYFAAVKLDDGERRIFGAPVLQLQHELLERSRLRT
ncbi:MAG: hypothetical protein ACRD1H_06190 [Vicinamibacterales bacterium]